MISIERKVTTLWIINFNLSETFVARVIFFKTRSLFEVYLIRFFKTSSPFLSFASSHA